MKESVKKISRIFHKSLKKADKSNPYWDDFDYFHFSMHQQNNRNRRFGF